MAEVDDAQRQERRKKAGDLLKMADKLFKGSDFEGAARLVNMAMEADPQNAYALAYQERVKYAIAQRDVQRLDAPGTAKNRAPEGQAGSEQTPSSSAPRPSPEEIQKKLEQAQRKLAGGQTRVEAGVTAPGMSPEPGAQQLRKELDEVVRDRDSLRRQFGALESTNQELQTEVRRLLGENAKHQGDHQTSLAKIQNLQEDLQKLEAQVAQSHNAIAAEREQWSSDRDGSRAQWEQQLSEERRRLEQRRSESEERLEAAAKTLRMQLEDGVHARALLQKQIQDLQAQLDLTNSTIEKERQKWGAEHAGILDANRVEWEQRLAEERGRLGQWQEEAAHRMESATSALQRQLGEATLQRDAAQNRVQELEALLVGAEGRFEEERGAWMAERESERATAEKEWGQRLAEGQALREATETELRNQLAALMTKHDILVEQFQNLRKQHEEVVARFSEEQGRWETDRQTLQEEQNRWDNERKEAERALQARHMAEMSVVKEQLQTLAQSRRQEESQSLQELRRTLERESAQRLDTAEKKFQEERQRMELEMQSRLAAELHRQEDLRRERDGLLTQLDGHRATSETERRRLEEEFQNRILTERTNAADEMRVRLEARFEQEREVLQRSTRAAVEAELQGRFDEERAAQLREQQRVEDELRRLNDSRQLEAQEGEAARSRVEEFRERLVEEQRVQEKRSQETLDAAQQRWKMDQERQIEEMQTRLIAEYERKLEEERQVAQELRNRDHFEALETRREIEEQLRKEFEAALMNRLKEERERFQSEYQDRMEGERVRLESELRSAFAAEAEMRSEEEDRIARDDRKAREAKERERRKEEEARKYEDAVRQAIEEGRHKAHLKKIASHMEQAAVLLKKTKFAEALDEVSRIFTLDPSHEEALALQHTIRAAQAEHDRRQEEVHRLQEEQKRRLAEIQARVKEQEQKDRASQKERAARGETVAQRIVRAGEYRRLGALDRALTEVQAVLTMEPGNGEAQDMEISILTQLKGHTEVRAAVARRTEQGKSRRPEEAQREEEAPVHRDHLRDESAQVYRSMLKRAWMQGEPGRDTRAMLDVARVSLGITEDDHMTLQNQVQLETYREALAMALDAALLEIDDVDAIDGIRTKYGVDPQDHEAILMSFRHRPS